MKTVWVVVELLSGCVRHDCASAPALLTELAIFAVLTKLLEREAAIIEDFHDITQQVRRRQGNLWVNESAFHGPILCSISFTAFSDAGSAFSPWSS
jgi:hypothetical protein